MKIRKLGYVTLYALALAASIIQGGSPTQASRWAHRFSEGPSAPFLIISSNIEPSIEVLHRTPDAMLHEAYGDLFFINLPAADFTSFCMDRHCSPDSGWIIIDSKGQLNPQPDSVPTNFQSLWNYLSAFGIIDNKSDLSSYLSNHPENLDAHLLQSIMSLKAIEFSFDVNSNNGINISDLVGEAEQSLLQLPIDPSICDHPDFFELHSALSALVRLPPTKLNEIALLGPGLEKLGQSIELYIVSHPDAVMQWRAYGMISALTNFDRIPSILDKLEVIPDCAIPSGPLALHYGLAAKGDWQMLNQVGLFYGRWLQSSPSSNDQDRASNMLHLGSYTLEAALRTRNINQSCSELVNIRAYSGTAWSTAALQWRTFCENLAPEKLPDQITEILDSPAPPSPIFPIKLEPLVLECHDQVDLTWLIDSHPNWFSWIDDVLKSRANPLIPKTHWMLSRGAVHIGEGNFDQGGLKNLEQLLTSESPSPSRVDVLRAYLKRHPGFYPVANELRARLRPIGSRDPWILERMRICASLIESPDHVKPEYLSRSYSYISHEVTQLEDQIQVWPTNGNIWKAWQGWNQLLPTPKSILSLLDTLSWWGSQSRLTQAIPITVWEQACSEMAKRKEWLRLSSWCQQRLFPSNPNGGPDSALEAQRVSPWLAQARAHISK